MIERCKWLSPLVLVLIGSAMAADSPALASRHPRPNVLFIFADDLSWEAIGATGGEVDTPHLDQLAARGTLFPRAHNMGAWGGAVCVASRTMLITGRPLWESNRLDEQVRSQRRLSENDDRTDQTIDVGDAWSELFANAGYQTYFTGKWHTVLFQPDQVFDSVGTVRPGMPRDVRAGYNRPVDRNDTSWQPWDREVGGFWEGGTHWSEVLRDEAVHFLRDAAATDKPFFMYLAFNAPHDPRQAPKEYVDDYEVDDIKVPENFLPEYPYKDAIECSRNLRDEALGPFPRTPFAVQKNRQEYYACITHLDDQIGAILEELESSGQADNTLIIFTADHGLAVGRHGLFGKQNMFDHSVCAPLIVSGPGIPQNERREARVYLQDVVPTSLEAAGIEVPDEVFFQSLMPVIRDWSHVPYETLYGAYCESQRMAIKDNWKIMWYPVIDKFLLFDLDADPMEMDDLSDEPDHVKTLSDMKQTLAAAMDELGDSLQLPLAPQARLR